MRDKSDHSRGRVAVEATCRVKVKDREHTVKLDSLLANAEQVAKLRELRLIMHWQMRGLNIAIVELLACIRLTSLASQTHDAKVQSDAKNLIW